MNLKLLISILVVLMPFCERARAQTPGQTSYPTSLDTSTTLPQAVDQRLTYLTAALTAGAMAATVNSTAGVPTSGVMQVDGELMAYATVDATHFSLTRGFSGTTAAAHALNATVRFPLVAAHVNGTRGAAQALEVKVGIGASPAASASTGHVLTKQSDGTTAWAAPAAGTSGTVTSVGLAAPAELSVTNSPVTSSGTLTLAWASQSANKVFASPDGSTGTPAFRALVAADIPAGLDAAKLADGSISNAEFQRLDGVSANVQTQLDAKASAASLSAHVADTSNPHAVTKAQVGLANVTNDVQLKIASNLSDLASAPTARTNLGLGTAAILNVPASGNAASGEVVKGSDTRLTDARTPTTHTHAAADVTSGTLATARLGSGTASSTTYLRGDQTWATPVTSITGTTNQVTASASTGPVTLSLPTSVVVGTSVGVGAAAPSGYQFYAQTSSAGVAAGFDIRSSYAATSETFFANFGDWGSVLSHNREPQIGTFVHSAASPNQSRAADMVLGRVNSAAGAPARMWLIENYPAGASTQRLALDWSGNLLIGPGSVATTATDGFPYIPTTAGAPSGVPTAHTGLAPLVYDTVNNKLCVYNSGWRCAQF